MPISFKTNLVKLR